MPKPRLAFLVPRGQDHFLPDIIAGLETNYDVRKFPTNTAEETAEAVAWGDTCWFEWCSELTVHASHNLDFSGKRLICRLHRIEAMETDHPIKVNWPNVDDLILVSHDIHRFLRRRIPTLDDLVRVTVIHNGVDTDRFAPRGTGDPKTIAWAGSLIMRKNPMLALQILAALVRDDSGYTLAFAGRDDCLTTRYYLDHMVAALGLATNVRFDGVVDDMAAWYADKGVILSTSIHESFGYAIAEAMAAGLSAAIHDYPGAEEFWPSECLFASVDDAVRLIRSAAPGRYRDLIVERYGLNRQRAAIRDLLAGPPLDRSHAVAFDADGVAIRMHLPDRHDLVQKIIALRRDFYERGMLQDIRDRLEPGGLALDIGANIGNHTVFFAKLCGLRVVALEPGDYLRGVLSRNVEANGLAARVRILDKAAGLMAGRGRIVTPDAHNLGTSFFEVDPDGPVETVALDDIGAGGPIALIKIDVEGMELEVLKGASGILSRDRPLLYVEVADQARFDAVNGFLSGFGYRAAQRFNATPTVRFEPAR